MAFYFQYYTLNVCIYIYTLTQESHNNEKEYNYIINDPVNIESRL